MKRLILSFLLSLSLWMALIAQQSPFEVIVEPFTISGLGGLQAFAFGQHAGKWLIVGGRLDGLHQRQPFASFDIAGHNNLLWVVDPVAQQSWSTPLTSLSTSLQEQLSSTNMEFVQTGDYLYVLGGYGYSATLGDHKTYDQMTAINVPQVIDAIVNGAAIQGYFRQITDNQFAVTGGHVNKVYDTYYLTGGQRFDGRYNPMGGATYTQAYTNQVRKFRIDDDGNNLVITHLPSITDATNLHRRDYNVAPQIMPNGEQGITAFSGVFQVGADLPFLNCVNIDTNGYTVNNAFSQYYNHYHCPFLPMYSSANQEMHSVFFGGIAQYYDVQGILTRDDNVPFVRTIARVTREANGTMTEYKLPVEMPNYLGASAEFIPLETLPWLSNEVLEFDLLPNDTTLVGYIYGGIVSTAPNIFFSNTGTQSAASNELFKVYVVKSNVTGVDAINLHSQTSLKLSAYPNPASQRVVLDFDLPQASDVHLSISDASGRLAIQSTQSNLPQGHNAWNVDVSSLPSSGTWFLTIEAGNLRMTQKLVLSK